jgi:hypothetical protein
MAFTGSVDVAANTLYVFKLPPLAHDASRISVGAYGTDSTAAGGVHVQGVVYADNNGVPGTVLGSSSIAITLSPGPQTTILNPVDLKLTAGTSYWVGIVSDVATTLRAQANAATTGYQAAMTFPAPFPDGSTATTPVQGNDWALWINVWDID